MTRSIYSMWAIVIAASATLLIMAGSHATRARASASAARRELATVSAQAAELAALGRSGAESALPERPTGSEAGLAAKVSAAMSRAGLAGSALQSVSPEARTPLTGQAGTKLVRQRATLALSGLCLPQVGSFLDAWRSAEPAWIVSGIDLSPLSAQSATQTGTDLPLRAVISIEGLFRQPTREPFIGVSR